MNTESQSSTAISQPNKPLSNNALSIGRYLVFGLCSLLVLIVGTGSVYFWQHHKVIELNNKLNNYQVTLIKDSKLSLDNLNALTALPNTVIDTAGSPADLIAFLGASNTQCYKASESGYYKVVAQANDQSAKMQYGCTAKNSSSPLGAIPSFILAKKTGNKWSVISPTNQWLPFNGIDTPSCTMVNDNKISKLVTPKCWQGPAPSSISNSNQQRIVVAVTNP